MDKDKIKSMVLENLGARRLELTLVSFFLFHSFGFIFRARTNGRGLGGGEKTGDDDDDGDQYDDTYGGFYYSTKAALKKKDVDG